NDLGNGNLAFVASSQATGLTIPEGKGRIDFLVGDIRDKTFDIAWHKKLGGTMDDVPRSMAVLDDGSLIVAGYTESQDKDVVGNKGRADAWVVRLTAVNEWQNSTSAAFTIVDSRIAARNIDIGRCQVAQQKDSVLSAFLVNEGLQQCKIERVELVGTDAQAFQVVSEVAPHFIPAGGRQDVEVRFKPDQARRFEAILRILTQSDTLDQIVTGDGIDPGLLVVVPFIDFGEKNVGTEHDESMVALVRNAGTKPLSVTSIRSGPPNTGDFTIVSGAGGTVLSPGQRHLVDLRFSPLTWQRVCGTLLVDHDGPGSPAVIRLFGRGVADTIRMTVALNAIEAAVGEHVDVVLSVPESVGLDLPSAPTNFTATIELPSTMIHVTHPAYTCVAVDSETCRLTVSGTRGEGSTLLTIPAVATLGTTDYASLRLASFTWLETLHASKIKLVDGSMRITDICDEGAPRLFIPSGDRYSLACRPNPVESTAEIHFGVAESGPISIEVLDRSGRVVITPVTEQHVQPGVYVRHVNARMLSAGPYIVVLRGANATLHTRMDVAR
ncbi:MAG: choice-of-anchor D domain-containing protein, partial [Candidatus Kapabacteria bacterium]|nr:choice-of-anchor D domain-containing protein [Candidatus Kapabacteria bacterium]